MKKINMVNINANNCNYSRARFIKTIRLRWGEKYFIVLTLLTF